MTSFRFFPLLAVLIGAGLPSLSVAQVSNTVEPEAVLDGLYSWETFMQAGEEVLVARMEVAPDTIVYSEQSTYLVVRDAGSGRSKILYLTADRLVEEKQVFYLQGLNDARALYAAFLEDLKGRHGTPTLEIDTGAMWRLTEEGATAPLKALVRTLRDEAGLYGDAVTTSSLLEAATPAQRSELLSLLGRQHMDRVYIQRDFERGVYTVELVRAAGAAALWDESGNAITLGAL